MEVVFTILLILTLYSKGTLGQEKELISNVNFGTFLTSMGEIVNSGSTWTHTFIIDELFEDPIPKNIRENISLSSEGCTVIAAAFTERARLSETGANVSIDKIRVAAVNMCNDVLSVTQTLNEQKNLLIAGIDRDVQSIRNFVYDDANLRDGRRDFLREKRSPADFVGIVGEKLFGIGRKQAVDLAHANIDLLRKQTNKSMSVLLANQQSLESVVKSQDKVVQSMTKAIRHQQGEIQELLREVGMARVQMEHLERISANNVMFVYNLLSYQHGLQTSLIRATISVIGNLQMLKDRTKELLLAFQKLASGYLPIELVPSEAVERALERIDNMLLRPKLQFHLAIRNVRYYYGMQCASYVTQGQLSIVLRIPLATVGALFDAYSVNAIKIPFTSHEDDGNENRYTRIGGFSEYFAISRDGEYYLEMSHKEMLTCKGIEGFPLICNPIKIMNSVRTRPSCTLALYDGNATMMSDTCRKEYYEQSEPDSQVYQVGANQILITAVEGQFIKHCAHGPQMVTLQACRLCIVKLPCGCNLKSKDVLVPPLLDGCNMNGTEEEIDFAFNLLLASELLNRTQLNQYRGNMTFESIPELEIPKYSVRRFDHETIVELESDVMDLGRVMQLAKVDEDIYLDDETYLATPKTLSEKISAMKFSGAIQVILAFMNIVALALGWVAYKKGCTSIVTSTAALQGLTRVKAASLYSGEYESKFETSTSEAELYWLVLKPYIYVYLTYLLFRGILKIAGIIHTYLSTRLLITPLEGLPARSESSHVYLSVSNGEKTLRLFVFTIDVTYHGMSLIQKAGQRIELGALPRWPSNPWSYLVPITNHMVLLRTAEGRKLKLPAKIRVPMGLMKTLASIVSTSYTTELCAGNGLYRVLTPEYYEVGNLSISEDGQEETSEFSIIEKEGENEGTITTGEETKKLFEGMERYIVSPGNSPEHGNEANKDDGSQRTRLEDKLSSGRLSIPTSS